MSIDSSAAFVEALRPLQLLETTQLDDIIHDLPRRFPQPDDLSRHLLKRGWLTSFQIDQIIDGQGKRLLLGQYILLERLGAGGMGEVFKARHRLMNRVVALKVIRQERLANPGDVKRFHKEIRAVAQLSHPNVVIAHDAGQEEGTHFFVMEYVEGVDLSKLVRQRGPLPAWEACDYIRQAALGLQHTHERGMIHRDIKPSNLLIECRMPNAECRLEDKVGSSLDNRQSAFGTLKILDMGLARLNQAADEHSAFTPAGAVMGTPDFIAPEQATDSSAVDIRADLYSLGCTLYFLLSGQVPFPKGTMLEKLYNHRFTEATPIEQLQPEVPTGVVELVRKLMAKLPADRFQTPAEAAEALTPWCHRDPSLSGALASTCCEGGALRQAESGAATAKNSGTRPGAGSTQAEAVTRVLATTVMHEPAPPRPRSHRALVLAGFALLLGSGLAAAVIWTRFGLPRAGDTPAAILDKGAVPPSVPVPPSSVPMSSEKTRTLHEGLALIAADPGAGFPGSLPWYFWSKHLLRDAPAPPPVTVTPAPVTPIREIAARQLCAIKVHTRAVTGVAFSRDGTRAVSCSDDDTVCLWDLEKQKELRQFADGHEDLVRSVALSANDRYLLTGSGGKFDLKGSLVKGRDNSVRLWNPETGREVRVLKVRIDPLKRKPVSHEDFVTSVAFSPDGHFAVSGSYDRTVAVWNVETGALHRTLTGHADRVSSVAFAPRGDRVVSGSWDKTARVWDMDSKKVICTFTGHGDIVTSVAFASGGQVVSGSHDKTILLWDAASGSIVQRFEGHSGGVTSVALALDGKSLLSGGDDGTVRLWDVASGKQLQCFLEHTGPVRSVAYAADGSRALSGGDDQTIRLWALPARP